MTHLGRDFSSYQRNLYTDDCAGIDFAFVKITEGDTYKNPYAPQQVAMLRRCGVRVGYYHFLSPDVPVGDQLHNCATVASALGVTDLPIAIDTETADAQGWPALASLLMDFAMGVEGWTNWVPNPRSMLYVDIDFYDNLPGFPWGRWVWLADPNPGAPHRACLVLQGAPRAVSGMDPKVVDPDTFMGSDADWAAFTRQDAPAPTPAPVPAPPAPTPQPTPGVTDMNVNTLQQGSTGNQVRMIQGVIGAVPDGVFGPQTKADVEAFQHRHGLTIDGIVGPQTWAQAAQG